jgi:hypothetical protein
MAAIGIALWKYVMRYAPQSPEFFNRDRFILSNGKQIEQSWRINNVRGLNYLTYWDRPHLSLPIHIPPPYWIQGDDF